MKSIKVKVGAVAVCIISVAILIRVIVARPPTIPPPSEAELENYFGDASCSWPCWQGITPGVTTSDDALQLLQTSPLVSQPTVRSESSKTGFGITYWDWKIGDEQPMLTDNMVWRNGIVHTISLAAFPTFSLGEAIDRFGPPDKIDVIDCTEVPEGKYRYLCGTLYYTKSGFEIHIDWQVTWNDMGIQITPSDPISFVFLFKPSTIEEWVASYGGDPQTLNLQGWKGYGNLYDLYFR